MNLWGWIKPVAELLRELVINRSRRHKLLAALEDPRYSEGRTLEALRREIGEADSEDGRERTRELLRGVRRGDKGARILKRSMPNAEEMWGLRP